MQRFSQRKQLLIQMYNHMLSFIFFLPLMDITFYRRLPPFRELFQVFTDTNFVRLFNSSSAYITENLSRESVQIYVVLLVEIYVKTFLLTCQSFSINPKEHIVSESNAASLLSRSASALSYNSLGSSF